MSKRNTSETGSQCSVQQDKKPKTVPAEEMDSEPATCPVCCSDFDSQLHQAFTNPCSHTVCEPCLRRLCRDGFECVVCRRPIQGFDQAVRCRALEEQNERVKPQQNSQARPVWSKYSVGGWASIVGIGGRPELNGQSALIVEYVPGRDRFRVQLPDEEVVSLKKENLEPDSSRVSKSSAELKEMARQRGNCFFRAGEFDSAVRDFTVALLHDTGDHHIYSNRSAAYLELHDYNAALQDGQQSVTLCPQFSKGWGRVAAANLGLGNSPGAIKAYNIGLRLDPNNANLRRGLALAEKKQQAQQSNTSTAAAAQAPRRPRPAPAGRTNESAQRPRPQPSSGPADFMSQSFSDFMAAADKAFEGGADGESDCIVC